MQNVSDNYYILIIIAMGGACLLVLLFILLQIRNKNKLLRQQKRLQEIEIHHQKELLHAVILSQEEERRRIGMDLHDEVGTVLSALRMTIVNLPDASGMAVLPEFKFECGRIIDGVITNVRSIAHNLSPFTAGAYGFMDALEDLCDHINQSGELCISLGYPDGNELNQLPGPVGLALYRVITELINNTLKHAKARNIDILVEVKGALIGIAYKDDGIGLKNSPAGHGMGMRNMESRLGMIGATYTIDTEKQQGFGLQIKLPLHHLS